jgi:hypothetical protein
MSGKSGCNSKTHLFYLPHEEIAKDTVVVLPMQLTLCREDVWRPVLEEVVLLCPKPTSILYRTFSSYLPVKGTST